MATPKLVRMGIKQKELHPKEATEPMDGKAYDKQEVRPTMHLDGAHAEMMGAADLKKGDRVQQTCEWVVTEHMKREENGKPAQYSMTLELDKGSDLKECDGDGADAEDAADDSQDGEPSPAMAYIQAQGKSEN